MGFRIVDRRVEWLGTVELPSKREAAKLGIATNLLADLLSERPLSVPSIKDAARAQGIGWRTIQKAKAELGVRSRKDGPDGPWLWEMAEGTTHSQAPRGREVHSQERILISSPGAKDAEGGVHAPLTSQHDPSDVSDEEWEMDEEVL